MPVAFDPVNEIWSETESMGSPRCVHTSTLLNDGRVIVVGGIDWTTDEAAHGFDQSIEMSLPPLSAVILTPLPSSEDG